VQEKQGRWLGCPHATATSHCVLALSLTCQRPTYWQSACTWSIPCQITSFFFPNFYFRYCAPCYEFFMTRNEKRGQNDAKPYFCLFNHQSIISWHPFDLKKIIVHENYLKILHTDLQKVLRSSEQGRGHEKRTSVGGTKSLNPSGIMNTFGSGSIKIHGNSQWVFTGSKKEPMWGEWLLGALKIMPDFLSIGGPPTRTVSPTPWHVPHSLGMLLELAQSSPSSPVVVWCVRGVAFGSATRGVAIPCSFRRDAV